MEFNKESKQQVNNRIKEFINELKLRHNNDVNILVVTHYDWLNHFFSLYFNQDVGFNNCEIRMVEI